MPARGVVDPHWEVTSKIVIAVAWLTDAVGASNDDVGGQGIAGTEGGIGVVGRAVVKPCSRVAREMLV